MSLFSGPVISVSRLVRPGDGHSGRRSGWAVASLTALGALAVTGAVAVFGLPVGTAGGQTVTLPSGRSAQFQELIEEVSGEISVARFRFVAPWVADGPDYGSVAADMEELCQTYAVSALEGAAADPARIIISLAQSATEFGVANPDITQFFESFSLRNGLCIWEAF
ncbi:DUF6497 family protein [Puniceibacterium confluentis]|uniref:DUF6497 family protein n=1 Tax=Puniceibacterium confluentis TaxID=1958944 RepID=UPI001FE7B429|nr:DUF6497 family protein [Puniceibacterium confluentis]